MYISRKPVLLLIIVSTIIAIVAAAKLSAQQAVGASAQVQPPAGVAVQPPVGAEALARAVGGQWLELLDAQRYKEAWEQCAPFFREDISSVEWVGLMQKARAPLGKVEHRSLRRLLVTNELPEAPLGNYVVLEFETRFSARPEPMIELVTPALVGANGKLLPPVGSEGAGAEAAALARWQVCGYYVRSLEPVEMLAAPQAELLPEAQNPRQAEQQTVPQR